MNLACSNCKVNTHKKHNKKGKKDSKSKKPTSKKQAISVVLNDGKQILKTINSNKDVIELLQENLVLVSGDKDKSQEIFNEIKTLVKTVESNRKKIYDNFIQYTGRIGSVNPQAVLDENMKIFNSNNVIIRNIISLQQNLNKLASPEFSDVAKQHLDQINKYINAQRTLENLLVELPQTLTLILATK